MDLQDLHPSETELDTFKIIANADTVDWSRTLRKPVQEVPEIPEEDEMWGGSGQYSATNLSHALERTHSFDLSNVPATTRKISPLEGNYPEHLKVDSHGNDEEEARRGVRTPVDKREFPMERFPGFSGRNEGGVPNNTLTPPHDSPRREQSPVREQSPRRELPRRRSPTPPLPPSPPPERRQEEPLPDDAEETRRPPKRAVRTPHRYTAAEENEDYEIRSEKEGILNEILGFARPPHNYKLSRDWNIATHTLDELQFELDRINSEQSANGVIDMAKSGIKFGVSGLETFLKQQGIDSVDGWYTNSCKDMSKFNRPLGRLYKKYWRNTQLSPMMEMAYLLGGSLAWTIAENKMGFRKSASAPAATIPTEMPQAASFEAPSTMKMRPPSNSFTAPKWGAETRPETKEEPPRETKEEPPKASFSTPSASLAVPSVPTSTVPSTNPTTVPTSTVPQPNASEEMLKKLSEQNDLVIQLLQTMAVTKMVTPKKSPETSPRIIRVKHTMSTGRKSTKAASTVHKEEILNLDD